MSDGASSLPGIGRLVGNPFQEHQGMREGAPESPHLSRAYIGDLRLQMKSRHPRLCKLSNVVVSILLSAEDAAIPADSAEDLQLAAQFFEDF
eukprot:3822164-Karenia_brevis.AAC.1